MFTGFVSADSVSDERIFTVPSCYLYVCKVGKLPFKTPGSFWCPSLHLLFKGGKERSEGRGMEEGSNMSQVIEMGLLRLSSNALPPAPKSTCFSCSLSVWPNSHCRGSIFQFPDLVGCILLCKHSPLGLWNPKQHLYLHLNGERQNSPEISPQVAFVCFWLLKTGMRWDGHRIGSCKQIVES